MGAPDMTIDRLVEDFSLLDEYDDRIRYVIELGKTLPPLSDDERTDANKVRGCASQVWLVTEAAANGAGEQPVLSFRGDSDAHIVRGLIAILLAAYSGRKAGEITSADPEALLARIGLRDHLTAQRSNGLSSMVARIRADANAALSS
jgi:cysteine desulfuration protein SufE